MQGFGVFLPLFRRTRVSPSVLRPQPRVSVVAKAKALEELFALVWRSFERVLMQRMSVRLQEQEMRDHNKSTRLEQVGHTGFNPSLLVDDDEDKEWEEDEVAHHHKREIRNGAGTQVGEGNGADGVQA